MMAMFFIVGSQIVITSFFQSIGKTKVSIFLSLSRQLLLLVPAIAILPHFFGLNGVWLSMPVSDGIATVLALLMMFIYMQKFKAMHKALQNS